MIVDTVPTMMVIGTCDAQATRSTCCMPLGPCLSSLALKAQSQWLRLATTVGHIAPAEQAESTA